jgi:hypothetical protein
VDLLRCGRRRREGRGLHRRQGARRALMPDRLK